MNQQVRDGGVLFPNGRKQQPSHPDFTGTLRLSREAVQSVADQVRAGVEFPALDLAAWKKVSSGGNGFIAMSAKKPYEKGQSNGNGGGGRQNKRGDDPFSMGGRNNLNDEIPF